MELQRLNHDNSWYIGIGNLRLLVDPWLEGTEIDYFPWFNTQWHRTPPIPLEHVPPHDAVLITQKYPDHFHLQTLKLLNPRQIIAPESIIGEVKRNFPEALIFPLSKSQNIVDIQGVRLERLSSLPRLGPAFQAISVSDGVETVIFAPHGHKPAATVDNTAPVKLLLTTFNEYKLPFFLGGTLAPGISGLQELVRAFRPNYVAATHDEDKHATGLVMRLARVRRYSHEEIAELPELRDRLLNLTDYQMVTL